MTLILFYSLLLYRCSKQKGDISEFGLIIHFSRYLFGSCVYFFTEKADLWQSLEALILPICCLLIADSCSKFYSPSIRALVPLLSWSRASKCGGAFDLPIWQCTLMTGLLPVMWPGSDVIHHSKHPWNGWVYFAEEVGYQDALLLCYDWTDDRGMNLLKTNRLCTLKVHFLRA